MERGSIDRLIAELAEARRFLQANEAARNIASGVAEASEMSLRDYELLDLKGMAPSIREWRVMDHCAAINRVYAVFENFVETVLADWIAERSLDAKFSSLPQDIIDSYPIGVSHVLGSISHTRYSHLRVGDIISGFNDALSGSEKYRLFPECLTYHRNNFRWAELLEILKRCGIQKFSLWVSESSRLKGHFDSRSRIVELVEAELLELIQYRNDAAHGQTRVDEICSRERLEEFFDFIKVLCVEIFDAISDALLDWKVEAGEVALVGKVSEKFRDNIRIGICEGVTLTRGDFLIARHTSFCREVEILSLQVDGESRESVSVATATEIGFRFNEPVPLQANLCRETKP